MQDPNKFKQLQSIEKFFSTMIPGCLDRQGLDIRGLRVKIYGDDKNNLFTRAVETIKRCAQQQSQRRAPATDHKQKIFN